MFDHIYGFMVDKQDLDISLILFHGQRKLHLKILLRIDTESLTSKGYADMVLECINHDRLKTLYQKIVCMVAGRLRAQVIGLDPESNELFQQ